MKPELAILLYVVIISLLTATVTAADKIKAKHRRRRIPEAVLFSLAFLGGAAAEYLTMRLIRHKTLHKRFMIGLPVIIFFQLAAAVAVFWLPK